MECSAWSENLGGTFCSTSSNESWIALDNSMNITDKSKCEKICKQKGVFGCCFLNSKIGCQFKPGSHASLWYESNNRLFEGKSSAVTCYPSGTVSNSIHH